MRKRLPSLIILALLAGLMGLPARAAGSGPSLSIKIRLEKTSIPEGRVTRLVFDLSGDGNLQPPQITVPEGLALIHSESTRNMQMGPRGVVINNIFYYYIRGLKAGAYTLGPYSLTLGGQTCPTLPQTLKVTPAKPIPAADMARNYQGRFKVSLSTAGSRALAPGDSFTYVIRVSVPEHQAFPDTEVALLPLDSETLSLPPAALREIPSGQTPAQIKKAGGLRQVVFRGVGTVLVSDRPQWVGPARVSVKRRALEQLDQPALADLLDNEYARDAAYRGPRTETVIESALAPLALAAAATAAAAPGDGPAPLAPREIRAVRALMDREARFSGVRVENWPPDLEPGRALWVLDIGGETTCLFDIPARTSRHSASRTLLEQAQAEGLVGGLLAAGDSLGWIRPPGNTADPLGWEGWGPGCLGQGAALIPALAEGLRLLAARPAPTGDAAAPRRDLVLVAGGRNTLGSLPGAILARLAAAARARVHVVMVGGDGQTYKPQQDIFMMWRYAPVTSPFDRDRWARLTQATGGLLLPVETPAALAEAAGRLREAFSR